MTTTDPVDSKIEFPRDSITPVSSAGNTSPSDFVAVGEKPTRESIGSVFGSMPILVKLSAIWLILIVGLALYAKLDTSVFGGALPLQDPNFQTNNFDPSTGEFGDGEPLTNPTGKHWLGTDAIARDTFARLAHGGWVSLIVALVAASFGLIVGGFLGALVGYVRGVVETIVMWLIDVILAFPALVLLLAMVSIFRVRSLFIISLVIGVLSIPAYTRVARANSLAVSNREFVTAARAIGTSRSKILFREIIPNVMPTLISYAMVAAAFVVVVEGTLSFLGLSVQLPQSSWGNMINQARADIKVEDETFLWLGNGVWQVIWPSLALTFSVLSLNQVGDFFQKRRAVRDAAI